MGTPEEFINRALFPEKGKGRPKKSEKPEPEEVPQSSLSKRYVNTIATIEEAKMWQAAFPNIPVEQLVGRKIELTQGERAEKTKPNLTTDLYDVIEFQKAVYMLKMLQQGMTGNDGAGKSSGLTIEDVRKVLDESKREDLLKTIADRLGRLESGGGVGARSGVATLEDMNKLVNDKMRDQELKRLQDERAELEKKISSTPAESGESRFYREQLKSTMERLTSLADKDFIRTMGDTMDARYAPVVDKLKQVEDQLSKLPAEERKSFFEKALGGVEEELAKDIGQAILTRFKGESNLITKDEAGKPTLDLNAALNKLLGIVETAVEKLPATAQPAPPYHPAQFPTEQTPPPASTSPPETPPSSPEKPPTTEKATSLETPAFISGGTGEKPIITDSEPLHTEAEQPGPATSTESEPSPNRPETDTGRSEKNVGRRKLREPK